MCADPITFISLGLTAVRTLTSFQDSSAQQQGAQARADAAADEARDARIRGIEESEDRREEAVQLFSNQRAAAAANDNVFDGSIERLALDDYEEGVEDALQVRENAERESDSLLQQAGYYEAEADYINPIFAAGTTLAGGIYDVSSDFDWMREDNDNAFEPSDYSVG